MARAVLQIDVDTSNVARAMGDLRGIARSSQAAMTAEARRASRDRDRVARDEAQAKRRAEAEVLRAKRKAESDATRAAQSEARSRQRIAETEARTAARAVERATAAHEAAERRKTRTAEREERQRTRAAEREERRRTNAAVHEAQTRARRIGAVVGRGGSSVVGAVGGYATDVHGRIQGARRERALANRNLTYVLGGAGIRGFDAQAQRTISAFAERSGMNYGDVVEALLVGQQRGSALELRGRTPTAALNDALNVVGQANATGTNAGQLLAARGRIGAAGITGANLDELMRYVQFAADRGSVEVDQIIQQGLPGALRLMSSRSANVSPEQRQRAAVDAFRESVAVQEVFAGTGLGPTRASNTLAALQSTMSTPRRQDLMLTNLRNYAESLDRRNPEAAARRAAVESLYNGPNAIFEQDPTRGGNARRLRTDIANNPLLLSERIATAMGGNAQAAANIFAGGGHGNAQAFLSNMRNMMETLASINPETGKMRTEAVREIAGGGYTQADIDARRDAVERDDLAAQGRAKEIGDRALTNADDWRVRRSNQVADAMTRDPFGAAAIQQSANVLGGILAPAVERGMSAAVERLLGGRGTPPTVPGGTPAPGGLMGTVPAAAPAGVGLFGAVLGALGVTSVVNAARTAITGNEVGGGRADTVERVNAGIAALTPGAAIGELARQFAHGVAAELRANPLRAEISTHEAAHARSGTPAPAR